MPSFELRDYKGKPTEFVSIESGVDLVHRPATDADRQAYFLAYSAFKKAAPVVAAPGPVEVEAAPVLPVVESDNTPAETPKAKRKKLLGVL